MPTGTVGGVSETLVESQLPGYSYKTMGQQGNSHLKGQRQFGAARSRQHPLVLVSRNRLTL